MRKQLIYSSERGTSCRKKESPIGNSPLIKTINKHSNAENCGHPKRSDKHPSPGKVHGNFLSKVIPYVP